MKVYVKFTPSSETDAFGKDLCRLLPEAAYYYPLLYEPSAATWLDFEVGGNFVRFIVSGKEYAIGENRISVLVAMAGGNMSPDELSDYLKDKWQTDPSQSPPRGRRTAIRLRLDTECGLSGVLAIPYEPTDGTIISGLDEKSGKAIDFKITGKNLAISAESHVLDVFVDIAGPTLNRIEFENYIEREWAPVDTDVYDGLD